MISRITKAAMAGIHGVKATVGTPTKDSVGTGAGGDQRLPNEATIVSRALKMTMRWVRTVSATVATSRVNIDETCAAIERNLPKRSQFAGGGSEFRRQVQRTETVFAKTKPIYNHARSQRPSRRDGARPSGNHFCENEANLPRRKFTANVFVCFCSFPSFAPAMTIGRS